VLGRFWKVSPAGQLVGAIVRWFIHLWANTTPCCLLTHPLISITWHHHYIMCSWFLGGRP
jgi:F0F1-type ATP synthase assembly protein I